MFRFLMSSLKTLTPAYGHLRTSKESRTFANALDPKSRFLGPSIMVKWAATIRVLEMSTMTKNPSRSHAQQIPKRHSSGMTR